jgi:hypothetical protein
MRIWNFIYGWLRTKRLPCDNPGTSLFRGSNHKAKLITACLLGFLSAAQAAENEHTNQQNPDLAFLEFLGQFETDSGEWIDPGSLLTEEFGELLDASTIPPPAPNSGTDTDSGTNDKSNSASTDQQSKQ